METELSTPNTRREKEVWQACDDLWAQNASSRHLTGDNIRDRLVQLGYKRGSPNEIYRYRSSWKQSRGISDAQDEAETENKASDPISRAVSLVYDQMRSQTTEAIDRLTEDYEMRLKAALLEEETLRAELAKLGGQNATSAEHLAQAQRRLNDLEHQLLEEKREGAVLNERVKGTKDQLESMSAEHRALIAELKSFHEREVDLWRAQNMELQKALTEQKRAMQAELDKQGARFSDELMQLKTELRQASEEKAHLVARLGLMEQSLKEAMSQTANLAEERKAQIRELTRLRGECESLVKVVEAHKAEAVKWQSIVEKYFENSTKSLRARDAKDLRWL